MELKTSDQIFGKFDFDSFDKFDLFKADSIGTGP